MADRIDAVFSRTVSAFAYARSYKSMVVSCIALGLIVAHQVAHWVGWQ
ncbi:MAG: hypothetical protein ACR2QF_03560 [Geminicoccaceae bacterium]